MKLPHSTQRRPGELLSYCRCSTSGVDGVKLTTRHGNVGDQLPHGNRVTETSIKLQQTQRIGTWHRRGLLCQENSKFLRKKLLNMI